MRRNKLLAALAVTGAILATAPAFAAEGGNFQEPQETFVGRFMSKTTTCPSLDFHLTEGADRKLTGMAFDPAMSGQMSSLSGVVGADGKVHVAMTAMGDKGPSGTVDGVMHGTTMVLSVDSARCPMATVKLVPVQREIHQSAG